MISNLNENLIIALGLIIPGLMTGIGALPIFFTKKVQYSRFFKVAGRLQHFFEQFVALSLKIRCDHKIFISCVLVGLSCYCLRFASSQSDRRESTSSTGVTLL